MKTKDIKVNTVAVRMFMACTDRRPNAKMSIPAHQEIGTLLNVIENVCHKRLGVRNKVRTVICILDDWLQCEYRSSAELSDEMFFKMYYGHQIDSAYLKKNYISELDRERVSDQLQRTKDLLKQHYPPCGPLKGLLGKLDSASDSLAGWVAK